MTKWKAIHLFGYGESQIIGKDGKGKVATNKLSTVSALLAHLATKQQEGTTVSADEMFGMNIFNDCFIDFLPKSKGNKVQRFLFKDIDAQYLENLSTEIIKNLPVTATTK